MMYTIVRSLLVVAALAPACSGDDHGDAADSVADTARDTATDAGADTADVSGPADTANATDAGDATHGVTVPGADTPPCDVATTLCDAAHRTAAHLVSTNGFGALVYDVAASKTTTLFQHLYRNWDEGVWTRDLLFDTYLGVRVGDGAGTWLDTPPDAIEYLDDAGVIRLVHRLGAVVVETFVYAPFELDRPALVLLGRATNVGGAPLNVSLCTLHNYKVGFTSDEDPVNPDGRGEQIGARPDGSWEETGVGGTFVHRPIGPVDRRGCATTSDAASNPYERLQRGEDLGDQAECRTGDDQVAAFQRDLTLAPGASGWIGVVSAYAGGAGAGAVLDADLDAAYGDDDAEAALTAARAAWEAWRVSPPSGLSAAERAVWRQSEAVLRMGQVRETTDLSHGQILASLPPGVWHITWMRDMAYAIVALARMGHHAEARAALAFVLEADSGHYATEEYTQGVPYQVTITRYFGRGKEETDSNADGPNIEFDGFGLFLWALGEYVAASGDATLLDAHWDTVDGLVADALVALIDPANGLVRADSSIWEVHWNGQQRQFSYTSLTAARGLCEAAALATARGADADAAGWLAAGRSIRNAVVDHVTDAEGAVAQSREDLARGFGYRDAAALEAVALRLVEPTGTTAVATLDALEELRVPHGLGYFRNDDGGDYDSAEWVFVDLRASVAQRLAGRTGVADALADWITAQALANWGLIAELHDRVTADYAGAVPMVGFGAGAWIVATLAREAPLPATPACGTWGYEKE